MKRAYALCIVFVCLSLVLRSQNNCGLEARFTPGHDTVTTSSALIKFTNTSVNATSYQFFIDGFSSPLNTDVTRLFDVGLHKVQLIAINGTCRDTAVSYVYAAGTAPIDRTNLKALYGLDYINQNVVALDTAAGGGYIIGANIRDNSVMNFPDKGLLIKVRESGCIEWSKFVETNGPLSQIYDIKATPDGGYVGIGFNNSATTAVFRLDPQGLLLWSRVYSLDNDRPLYGHTIRQIADGGYILTGGYLGMPGLAVVRLDAAGNPVWNKYFNNRFVSTAGMTTILQQGNYVYVGGTVIRGTEVAVANGLVIKIDNTTGLLEWSKTYIGTTVQAITDMHLLPSGQILINSNAFHAGKNPLNTFLTIDSTGSVKSSGRLESPEFLMKLSTTKMVPLPSGKFYVLATGTRTFDLQPGSVDLSLVVKLRSDYSIEWVRNYGARDLGKLLFATRGPNESFVAVGEEFAPGVIPLSHSDRIMFRRIDSSGSDELTTCFMREASLRMDAPLLTWLAMPWQTDSIVTLKTLPSILRVPEAYTRVRYDCPDFLDACSYLRLTGPQSICNLNNTYTYRVNRNRNCIDPVQWQLSGLAQIVNETDSSITVKFNSPGRHVIRGTLQACSPVQDSIVIFTASKNSQLNLGSDTAICGSNNLILRAGPGFLNYRWSNGDTDSLLAVNTSGKYWVTVTDSCQYETSDTIIVNFGSSIPFTLSPDRTKCSNDTIHLVAPAGYVSYSWSPLYSISGANSERAVVNPAVDTVYFIQAETSSGCFVFDTIRVKVINAPLIQLGDNISICESDSVVLNAGTGFSIYAWNTGASTQSITVKQAGLYSVQGTTAEGCTALDTLEVMQVFSKPIVTLDDSPVLCFHQTRTLDAGNFNSYLWSDGSTGRSLSVNSIGTYYVTVMDDNQCEGSDTVSITSIRKLPDDLLPSDTTICTYGKLKLKPLNTFNQYLWSTNERTAEIDIQKPGKYWIKVTDQYGCVGEDTVRVKPKDCSRKLQLPNAFSPGNDGKNDEFKPIISGDPKIIQYRLVIYNMNGQRIFESDNPKEGWKGNNAKNLELFVWMCTYQFDGEEVRSDKGLITVTK